MHSTKTKIFNLRGTAEMLYSRGFDFLGFTIKLSWFKIKGKMMLVPSISISTKSRNAIMAKFKTLQIHKMRKPIEHIANLLKPILNGNINYYGKFSISHIRCIWNQLNVR